MLTVPEQNIQKSQRRKLQDVELSHSSMASSDDQVEEDSILVGLSKSSRFITNFSRGWQSCSENINVSE